MPSIRLDFRRIGYLSSFSYFTSYTSCHVQLLLRLLRKAIGTDVPKLKTSLGHPSCMTLTTLGTLLFQVKWLKERPDLSRFSRLVDLVG